MTMFRVILNVGDKEFACGLTYTGTSRVKSLSSLAFDPMPDFSRITNIFAQTSFQNMRAEIQRRQQYESDRLDQVIYINVVNNYSYFNIIHYR